MRVVPRIERVLGEGGQYRSDKQDLNRQGKTSTDQRMSVLTPQNNKNGDGQVTKRTTRLPPTPAKFLPHSKLLISPQTNKDVPAAPIRPWVNNQQF